jgi:hypothetical protein
MRNYLAAVAIAVVPLATAIAGNPYDGTFSGPLQPGKCGTLTLTLTVTDSKAVARIPGVAAYGGTLDSSGRGTLLTLGVRSPRSFSVAVSGDKFEFHGDASCGRIDVIGQRTG